MVDVVDWKWMEGWAVGQRWVMDLMEDGGDGVTATVTPSILDQQGSTLTNDS